MKKRLENEYKKNFPIFLSLNLILKITFNISTIATKTKKTTYANAV